MELRMRVEPFLSADAICAAVNRLGQRISDDYAGKDLTILGILTGSVVFVADLMRAIPIPHRLGLLSASSYRGATITSGDLQLELSLLPDIRDRDVLLVDDILDTGKTLAALSDKISTFGPRSVQSAVLLWKKDRTVADVSPDYVGFEIPDAFVVGYGLDYDDRFRHLPYIGILHLSSE
jgi:hypoxanthine phosphoribosyltransferase